MSQKYATAFIAVACSVILLTVGYVGLHDMSQNGSPATLLESSLKQIVRRLWAGGNNKLALQRKNLESLGTRHKYIRSQLRKTLSLNAASSIKADDNTAPELPHSTELYAGPRRIRGYCGGPSKPAGMIFNFISPCTEDLQPDYQRLFLTAVAHEMAKNVSDHIRQV